MNLKVSSFGAVMILFLLSTAATSGEIAYYKGRMEIIETSGRRCNPNDADVKDVELVIRKAPGGVTGYLSGDGVRLGRFEGGKAAQLAVVYPFFNDPNSKGHTLSLIVADDALTGELRERHLEATAEDCNFDRAVLKMARVQGVDPAGRLAMLSAIFESATFSYQSRDLYRAGRFTEAEPLHLRALEILESKLGKDHPYVAQSLSDLAVLYKYAGRYEEAEPLHLRALEILESKLGKDHPDVAQSLNNLAVLYKYAGRYGEAEPLYKRALVILESKHDEDRPTVAQVLNNLAKLYVTIGRYGEAEPLFKWALEIRESKFGKDHLHVAESLDSLAELYDSTGRYGEAEPLLKRALEIRESKLGPDHLDVALSLNDLGALYKSSGYHEKAEPLFKRALEIREANLGKNHPDVAQSLGSLAMLYDSTGRYAEAGPLFKRALEIHESVHGRDHPDVAQSLNSIAAWYGSTGRYAEAEPLIKRALQVAQASMSPHIVYIQGTYAMVLFKLGRREAAIFYGKQVVNSTQRLREDAAKFGRETLRTLSATVEGHYRFLTDLLIGTGRLAEAQQVMELLRETEYFEFVRWDAKERDAASGRVSFTGLEAPLDVQYHRAAEPLAKLGAERQSLLDREALSTEEQARLRNVEKELEGACAVFRETIDEVEKKLSKKRSEKANPLKEAIEVREDPRELRQGAVALYTVAGESTLRLLLIAPRFRKAYEHPISEKELNSKIRDFRETLQSTRLDPLPPARELYSIILGPAEADLKELKATTLLWLLDGALRYLPVAALHDGKQYLAQSYSNVLLTPASHSRIKDKADTSWRGLGLGVSKAHEGFAELPAVRDELSNIILEEGDSEGIVPGDIRLDEAFNLNSLREGLHGRYPLVHIASHFRLAPGNDSQSYLLLGDGRHLTLSEMRFQDKMFEGVDLLTLSACETGIADGREVDSFGVLAQRQGAKGVMATLWPILDGGTVEFMKSFYRLREHEKLTKAEALRRTQVLFITGKNLYSHPLYWAPFILMGNWL